MDDARKAKDGRRNDDGTIRVLLAHVKALELRQIEHERKYFADRRTDAKITRVWRNKYSSGLANLEARIRNTGQTSTQGIEKIHSYLRFTRWAGYGLVIMLTGYITLFIDRFKALFVIGSD